MRLFSRVLCVCSLLLLCSCSKPPREYNISVKNNTNIELENVAWKLKPEGHFEPGFLSPNQGANYMMITHWPAPTEIELSFKDDKGEEYNFKLYPKLSENFYGDILLIIKKKENNFQAGLKTGKLRELAFE